MEAKCTKCGVTAINLEPRDDGGYSFKMTPGFALADLCLVIMEQKGSDKPPTEDACPNLSRAIEARIERFRKGQP